MKVYLIMHTTWEDYGSYSGDPEYTSVNSVYANKEDAIAEAKRLGDEALKCFLDKIGYEHEGEVILNPELFGLDIAYGYDDRGSSYELYHVDEWEVKE